MKHILSKLIHSSSYQIGTAFAVLMLLGTLFVSYWLVIASDDTLIKESEEAVRAELRGLVAIEASAGVDGLSNYLQQRQEDQKSGYFYSLRSASGDITQGNIPAWPGPDTEILKEGLILFEIDYDAIPGVPRSPRLQSEHIDITADK